MLLDVYETVYKIRITLLAHKNSPRTSQVQAAAKQVPRPKSLTTVSAIYSELSLYRAVETSDII